MYVVCSEIPKKDLHLGTEGVDPVRIRRSVSTVIHDSPRLYIDWGEASSRRGIHDSVATTRRDTWR